MVLSRRALRTLPSRSPTWLGGSSLAESRVASGVLRRVLERLRKGLQTPFWVCDSFFEHLESRDQHNPGWSTQPTWPAAMETFEDLQRHAVSKLWLTKLFWGLALCMCESASGTEGESSSRIQLLRRRLSQSKRHHCGAVRLVCTVFARIWTEQAWYTRQKRATFLLLVLAGE